MSQLIEGVANEVILLFSTIIALFFACLYSLLLYFRPLLVDEELDELENDQTPPPIHNRHMCPVCRGQHSFALETDCGHLYCGPCLMACYERDVNAQFSGIKCPLCRNQVSLLFVCFTPEERGYTSWSVNGSESLQIRSFVRSYNNYHSTRSRTFLHRIREMPVLLRHFIMELFETGFDNFYLSLRLLITILIGAVYILFPSDVIPESMFGFVGFIDDLVLSLIFVWYLASMYRHYLTDLRENED